MPLVSVILPCFNAEFHIRQAVQSILDQTFADFELIVVDDGSADGSVDAINALTDKRMTLLIQGSNSGYPAALRAGIEQCSGKYIARMDASDVSSRCRLAEQLKALARFPQAAFCGVARYRITPGGKMYADRKRHVAYYKWESWEDLMRGNRLFADPSVMVDKSRVASVGGYRTFQRSGMDVDLWLRVMEKFGPCVTITAPLFGQRLDPGSLIFNPRTFLMNQVTRVLANQRRLTGVDDAQRGGVLPLDDYITKGLVRLGSKEEQIGRAYGSVVTCITLWDWKGALRFARQVLTFSPGLFSKLKALFVIGGKLMHRLRANPYTRFLMPG